MWEASGVGYWGNQWLKPFRRVLFCLKMNKQLPIFNTFVENSKVDLFKLEAKKNPLILKSVLLPYISTNFSLLEKLEAIESHYQVLSVIGLKAFLFDENSYCNLAAIQIGEKELRVVLDKPLWMRYEGEMAINLFYGSDRVFSAAFSLVDKYSSIYVGALQGSGVSQDSKDLFAKLTTQWHGVRPRDMMVYVTCMMAKILGFDKILAVGDTLHPSLIKNNPKSLSYDQIWSENGGIQNEDGFFVVSSQMRVRESSEIAPKKRAMYRRRYELLGILEQEMRKGLLTDTPEIKVHG
jgi:uncharacterized protein VirK/YbjX